MYAAICVGPLLLTATVSITGSYPAAFWLRAAASFFATVDLLRIPMTTDR